MEELDDFGVFFPLPSYLPTYLCMVTLCDLVRKQLIEYLTDVL